MLVTSYYYLLNSKLRKNKILFIQNFIVEAVEYRDPRKALNFL